MKKKDKNINPQTSGDISPEELVRRLSEYNEKQTDSSSKTELDPEIAKLLKQYVVTNDDPDETEELPVMQTPNFEGIESVEIVEEPKQTPPSSPYRMRFKIKSHTINGVEVHNLPVADEVEIAEEMPEVFEDDDILIYQPAIEEIAEEITPDDDLELEEAIDEEFSLIEEVAEESIDEAFTFTEEDATYEVIDEIIEEIIEQSPVTEEYDYDDVYSNETIYAESDEISEEPEIPEEIEPLEEIAISGEIVEDVAETEEIEGIEEPEDSLIEDESTEITAEEEIVESDTVEDSTSDTSDTVEEASEPSAEEVIAEYLKNFMAAHSAPKEEPAAQIKQETAVNQTFTVENAESNELDEEDINLMLALGLEDELAKTVTNDVISDYSDKITRRNSGKKLPTSAEARTTEYVNSSQNREILDEYSKVYSGTIFKIIASFILAAALFCFENLSLFGITLSGPFNVKVYPIVYYMVEVQLLVFTLALTYKNFFSGLKGLFTFKPSPSSLISVAGLVALAYTVILCVFNVTDDIRLMGFPVAILAVLTSFYEFFNLRREILSFNVVSSKKPKFALALMDDNEVTEEKAAFASDVDKYATVASIEKVSFIDGFFTRTDKEPYYGTRIITGILGPFLAAIVVALLSVFFGDSDWIASLGAGVTTFLLCLPGTLLFTYSIPYYRAEKAAYDDDGAIIGEDVLDEFASTAILVYDDDEVFNRYGAKVRSVKIYGNNRIDKVIYNSASVFNGLGGLLGNVFRVAAGELGYSDNVEYTEIVDGGISATVDGVPVSVGSREYIESKGINIPDDHSAENYGGDVSVMYLSCGNIASAKMYISYELEPEFENVSKELDEAGICLGVNSIDPNITEEMLRQKLPENRYPIKVLRRQGRSEPADGEERRINSGIIARGSAKSLLSSVLLCDKVRHLIKTNTVVKLITMILGAALSAVLVISGNHSNMLSIFVGIYQVLCYLPIIIITRLYV